MGKKEARIARQEAKRLKDAAKTVRLKERPTEDRQIRLGADPGSIFHMQMTWTVAESDCNGAWTWNINRQWSNNDWATAIGPKLDEWSRLKWSEIDAFSTRNGHKMHHNMNVEDICDEAQVRLLDLGKHADIIFRFRLGGLPRLWGFRNVTEFQLLWFDPTHQIYPVDID